MTSPQMRPARPKEPRPEQVAAIARRNTIRNLEREAQRIRERVGPGERLDAVLEQLHVLYQQREGRA